MEKTKLWKLLLGLDAKDQQECRRFLASPYFNSSQSLIDFYEVCLKYLVPGKRKYTKETLWVAVFGNKEFNDVRFRKLSSDLAMSIEKFLAVDEMLRDQVQRSILELDGIGNRRIISLQKGAVQRANEALETQHLRNNEFFYQRFCIENAAYEFSDFETQHMEKSNVEEIINNLDIFYLSEKLRLYCTVLSRKNIVSHDYNLLFIDEIIAHVEGRNFKEVPAVYLYFLVLQTLRDPDNEQYYTELIAYADKHKSGFSSKELYHVYGQALNCCVYHTNKGRAESLEQYVALFEQLLANELVFHPLHHELSPWRFANTIAVYNRLGRYEQSEAFIEKYTNRLPETFRQNAKTYNLATVYFYQKKFEKVLLQLREVEYDDVTYNLGAKAILLATYYERKEWDALESHLDTFNTYLVRNDKLTPDRKANYKNLIRFTRRLKNLSKDDIKGLRALLALVQGSMVASKNWLAEKVAERMGVHADM